jgi:hypothetical protein
MTKTELKALIKEVISESPIVIRPRRPRAERIKDAKEKIIKLKAEYNKIIELKHTEDYLDTNDPQARNFHDKRLKEIPKEISKIRQRILDDV